jgi:glycoside hydrolase-like protein
MDTIATGLDYSGARLSGSAIRNAGYQFVNRYLWFPGQGVAYLTAGEYQDLTANDIEVHAIYEQTTSDPAGGWNAGVVMAQQAVRSAQSCGLPPGTTIYMCADAWLSTHGISIGTAMSFLDGARSILREAGYLTGAYGFKDFVYAAQDGGHADRFWLCGAESGVREGIHQYQWNNGRVHVSGLECDLNKQYLPMMGDDVSWSEPLTNPEGYTDTAGNLLAAAEYKVNKGFGPVPVFGQDRTTTLAAEVSYLPDNFARLNAKLDGLTAAITFLTQKVAEGGGASAAELEAAVAKAIRENTLEVDVTVRDRHEATLQEATGTAE